MLQIRRSGPHHHRLQLVRERPDRFRHTGGAFFLQRLHQRLSDGYGVRAQCQRLEGIQTAFNPAVNKYRNPVLNDLYNFGQNH